MASASEEGQLALARFKLAAGFQAELVAAEPLLANPVAFSIDEQGRFFVSETHRYRSSVLDIRSYLFMLEDDLALRTVAEREAMVRRHFGPAADQLALETEILRLVEDTDGDGKADRSSVYADSFNSVLDGIASGVLARRGKIYFTNIPHLWELQDRDGDGRADLRRSLSQGYGVRFSYTGHDMHGLVFGPDGKLYFSFGDRGAHVVTREGKVIALPDEGAVLRCNPDGSDLELVHRGLRNPQELAFDDYGNLFTGDNDSDQTDRERWVYVVEGGESGWRVGYQHAPLRRGGPWMSENLALPAPENTAAYLLPPIALLNDGPSGLTYHPGTGFPERYRGHFFLAHFKGSSARSGVWALQAKPKGASFELIDGGQFLWNALITDVDFGYDGALYVSDWHQTWFKTGKGRLYRITDPVSIQDPAVSQVKRLFAEGFSHRGEAELARLLPHPDKRVRQEAQFALAERGASAALIELVQSAEGRLARLHAVWGLGQIARAKPARAAKVLDPVLSLLEDADEEVRAQAARVLGDARHQRALRALEQRLSDPHARVRFFAALALGKLGKTSAVAAVEQMLRDNADQDLYLRHAGVMALAGIGHRPSLLAAIEDPSRSVRLAALLAMRRLHMPEIVRFLDDPDSALVLEAARAINDVPIEAALPALAALCQGSLDNEPLALRAVNAAFRLGGASQASSLAALAQRTDALPRARTEALLALSRWPQPPARDRIVGLYRPLSARDPAVAIAAIAPALPRLLASAPEAVRQAALHLVGRLELHQVADPVAELLSDLDLSGTTRAAALQTLSGLGHPSLAKLVRQATGDPQSEVRSEGYRQLAILEPDNVIAPLARLLEEGRLVEQQAAFQTLGSIATPEADLLLEWWLDELLSHRVRPELHLDILEAAAQRRTPALRQKLDAYQATRLASDPVSSFREVLHGGNAARGKTVFYESPQFSCSRCHSIGGEAGDGAGPALDGIASRHSREYLLESILDPGAELAPGFETGVPGVSGMPANFQRLFSKGDLRDLIEFLSTLKQPRPERLSHQQH